VVRLIRRHLLRLSNPQWIASLLTTIGGVS
jgi:hypothetical protein